MMEGMYGMTLCPRPRCVYPSPTGRTIPASLMPPPASDSPRLLDRVRTSCRRRHYSLHTERAYVRWIVRFVRFHDTTHPRLLAADVRAFLNHMRCCGLWVARFGLRVTRCTFRVARFGLHVSASPFPSPSPRFSDSPFPRLSVSPIPRFSVSPFPSPIFTANRLLPLRPSRPGLCLMRK